MIDFKKEFKDYLILLIILTLGLVAFISCQPDRRLQSLAIIATAAFYVLWGVIHHLSRGDFHLKVLLEYLAVSFLAVILVLTLLSRV